MEKLYRDGVITNPRFFFFRQSGKSQKMGVVTGIRLLDISAQRLLQNRCCFLADDVDRVPELSICSFPDGLYRSFGIMSVDKKICTSFENSSAVSSGICDACYF